jgi:hypothetical protein
LQTRRVLVSRHEKVPGVHTHGAQTPAEQVVLEAQAVSVKPRPSGLHTRRVPALRQLLLPGVQVQSPQRPVVGEQLCPEGHAVVDVYPSPVARHSRVPVEPTHSGTPGAQMRLSQVPALQLCVSAQGIDDHASPSAVQTSRPVRLPETQRAMPAEHTRSRHTPAEQLCAGPQAIAS